MKSKELGGILLVAGTAVGAGMLALPVGTGFSGFFPSSCLLIAVWFFMTYTAFLMLEVALWDKKPFGNMLSMSQMTLGKWGRAACWAAYLFLLYALNTAYLAGGAPLMNGFLEQFIGVEIPDALESIPILLIFGTFVYKGVKTVDPINRFLMIPFTLSYVAMVVFLMPEIDLTLLKRGNFREIFFGASLAVTAFGYHIIIPTLVRFLDRDVLKLKRVLLIGSIIPLVVYLLWQALVLGIVPLEGKVSIASGYAEGESGAYLVGTYLENSSLHALAPIFSFFAIVTSFLGVSMALSDFLADGLNIQRTLKGNLSLLALTFLPPLVIVTIDPTIFILALEFAGAFGVVFLLGLLPILMVWRGREKFSREGDYKAPFGKAGLLVAFIVFSLVMVFEILGWVI